MMRRIVIGLVVIFVVANALAWSIFKAGSHWHGGSGNGGGPPWFVPVFGLFLLLTITFYIGHRVRRAIAPVAEVMDAADRVAAGDYTARVEPTGKAEMRNLGVSFNRMAERLRENEAQRRAMFADVAHELRTPLAIIQGNVEAMLDGVYPRSDEQLVPLLEQTRVMARLLDDLRTLSVAQAHELKLHRERVCPAALLEEVAAAFRRRAEARGIVLAVDSSATEEIEADPLRLRQVLDNLVANAIRYAPDGGRVAVQAERVDGSTRFSVTDNGPGIPPEQLPRIFDRFVKAADSGGSGLGLAIAKSLVEAHDGRIWATSEPGRGATFHFEIPNGNPSDAR
jgi:signal transduction histidine kinase